MKKIELIRNCPICNSLSGYLIHNQSFALLEGSPLPDNYNIVHCSDCGFVFADTPSSQNDYNRYYTLLSKYEDLNISSGGGFNQSDYNRLVRTADFLESSIVKSDYILDLGCANGGQLKVLKERGFLNLVGVDPSEACVRNVKSSGIDAFQAHLFDRSKQQKKIGNHTVFSPDFLLNKEVTLLICSALYSNEILKLAQSINKGIKYIIIT